MDENKRLAIELAQAFIQNLNVKPVYNDDHNNEEDRIVYKIDKGEIYFSTIVSHFHAFLREYNRQYY